MMVPTGSLARTQSVHFINFARWGRNRGLFQSKVMAQQRLSNWPMSPPRPHQGSHFAGILLHIYI
eukprot:7765580-Pyramimonas_sp.AAC.1